MSIKTRPWLRDRDGHADDRPRDGVDHPPRPRCRSRPDARVAAAHGVLADHLRHPRRGGRVLRPRVPDAVADPDAAAVHRAASASCVESVAKHYADQGGLEEGDVVVVNDPFLTGTHQWDVAVIVPGFLDGELVAYAAIKAHHLDVGAMAPFVSNSTDVFQEGTIYPGRQALQGGRRDEDIYRHDPRQHAAARVGGRRPQRAGRRLPRRAARAARTDAALRPGAVRGGGRGDPGRRRGEDARASSPCCRPAATRPHGRARAQRASSR